MDGAYLSWRRFLLPDGGKCLLPGVSTALFVSPGYKATSLGSNWWYGGPKSFMMWMQTRRARKQ